MKQVFLMIAVVALVGCGEKEPKLRSEKFVTPNEAANELFVEAVQLFSLADSMTGKEAIDLYDQGLIKLQEIIAKHSKSDLAVKLISGETLFTNRSLKQIQDKVDTLRLEVPDPIVVKAVRKELRKPADKLTKADLAKVTRLSLHRTQITDAGLKDLAKLQNLKVLDLSNTKITDAGVAKLQKALPFCRIDYRAD